MLIRQPQHKNRTISNYPTRVVAAEAAIASADWKTAEAKLDPWLATHPNDARALFDAGYVADAQNRLDDAASLYRAPLRPIPTRLKPISRSGCCWPARESRQKPEPICWQLPSSILAWQDRL